jgi:hypothetical protein
LRKNLNVEIHTLDDLASWDNEVINC